MPDEARQLRRLRRCARRILNRPYVLAIHYIRHPTIPTKGRVPL